MAETAEIANIAETEELSFFRKVQSLGLSKRRLAFYSESLEVAKCQWKAYQMVLFLKNVFCPNDEVFFAKNSKNCERCKKLKL